MTAEGERRRLSLRLNAAVPPPGSQTGSPSFGADCIVKAKLHLPPAGHHLGWGGWGLSVSLMAMVISEEQKAIGFSDVVPTDKSEGGGASGWGGGLPWRVNNSVI